MLTFQVFRALSATKDTASSTTPIAHQSDAEACSSYNVLNIHSLAAEAERFTGPIHQDEGRVRRAEEYA